MPFLEKPSKVLFWPVLITVGVMILFGLVNMLIGHIDVWGHLNLELAEAGITQVFCEPTLNGQFLKNPISCWTNFIYLFCGVLFLRSGYWDLKLKRQRNFLVRFPLFSILMGVSAIYVFIGSSFYHASLTMLSHRIDGSGVMAEAMIPLVYFVFRLFGMYNLRKSAVFMLRSYRLFIIGIILINIILFILHVPHAIVTAFIVLATVGIAVFTHLKFKLKFTYKYLYIAFTTFLLAGAMWKIDTAHLICNAESIFQLHAGWHLLSGIALVYVYLFFRSERKIVEHNGDDNETRIEKTGTV